VSQHLKIIPVVRRRVYASQAQEAFFEGHVTAFEVTGGVPWRHVRYDNLSPAVSKVLTGRTRAETSRWQMFRSWYKSVPASSQARPGRRVAAGSGLTWAQLGVRIDLGIRGVSS